MTTFLSGLTDSCDTGPVTDTRPTTAPATERSPGTAPAAEPETGPGAPPAGPEALGRREANKLATRRALQQAADRLFADQGYATTTVRDIAAAAGVTERTFFRYFAGKEELIVDDAIGWLETLQERIRKRPASEDPVTALRRAVLDLASSLAAAPRPSPLWLFTDGPPGPRISRRAPGTRLRIEAGLAEVIRERLERSGTAAGIENDYLADILARTVFGLIRSALIRDWQLRSSGARRPAAATLINQAFATMRVPVAAQDVSGAGGADDAGP
jgi:AcrR family transcriptional regulator